MKISSKVIEDNNAREKNLDENGVVITCHLCGGENCYMLFTTRGSDGQEYMVRQFLSEKEGALCVECFDWMQNSGTYVTKFLHMVLRVVIFFRKRKR